jgi:putative ABC transport system permease protein
MLNTWLRDVRLAARSLLRERGVTAVALGSLALGIAANATVFSLVQAVEFPRLIYPDASRIVFLESRNVERDLSELPISAPDALDVAAAVRTLDAPNLTGDQTSVIREASIPARRSGRQVTPAFFQVMGVAAARGRVLTSGDADAVVVSDGLWRGQLAADPDVVGKVLHLDDTACTVVGVMPERFDFDADFWVMLPRSVASAPRDDRQFTTFARLRTGASVEDADRELSEISARLAAEHPATNRGWSIFSKQLTRMHGQDSRGVFFLLQAAVAFVLLIACANIANILLARGTLRAHEMALRVSLGASRGQLLRQLLTESLLLSSAGGALGVVLTFWGVRLARVIGGFPDVIDPTVNWLVLAFAAAVSILTGVLCGIVPALRASSASPSAVLRSEGGRGETTSARGRLRGALVALQVASAVVLAATAGLMLQTFVNRERVDLGFNPTGAFRADLSLGGARYANPSALRLAVDDTLGRLRQNPGIVAAGASAFALSPGVGARQQLTLPGEADRALPPAVRLGVEAVTPEYFAAMGVPLRQGRAFSAGDAAGGTAVALVNEELARLLWPGRSPLGERVRVGSANQAGAPAFTIVGVVASVRRSAMHDFVIARVYVPYAQYPNRTLALVVRSAGNSSGSAIAIGAAVRQTDPALVVDGLRTVEEDAAQFLAPVRLITTLLASFGVAGLLLAALGVFGTMSYAVSQRQREMAVRSALGAGRSSLVWLVLRSGLSATLAGAVPGVLAAIAAGRALESFLYGVAPADPATLTAAVLFLAVISLAACARPARIAATVDPMTILRRP